MRSAVIGVGRMGRKHIEILRGMSFEIVGITDAKKESMELALKEQQVPNELHFADAKELLNETRPKCVVVATTAPSHCDLTCFAAENGAKYILCEKPMATSLDQCDKMIRVCKANGALLAINHQMRYMEQYIEAKRLVNSDEVGGLSSVTVVAGSFGLAMNGTHYFEMFRYMTGEPPVEVTAWFSHESVPNPRGVQYEDRAGSVRMTTASGRRFYLETGSDQGHGVKAIYAGAYGQLVVDELAGVMHLSVREEQSRQLPTTRYGMPSIDSVHKIEPASLIDPSKAVLMSLVRNTNPPTGQDGRLAVAALVAAYVSHENGHTPIAIDDQCLPLDRVFPWA